MIKHYLPVGGATASGSATTAFVEADAILIKPKPPRRWKLPTIKWRSVLWAIILATAEWAYQHGLDKLSDFLSNLFRKSEPAK